MGKRWRVKPNKSLRENARLAVPNMMDDFLGHTARVIGHPRLKNELHQMRLAGKKLRYAMEVFVAAFGKDFESYLEEIKHLLDVMGRIHDYDTNIPLMRSHLREVRLFNRTATTPRDKVSTGSLTILIREQLAVRQSLFLEMTTILEQWGREHFEQKVIRSMMVLS